MSTQEPTLYELLGVDPDADTGAIKKAYRTQARRVHPDVNPGLESMFLMIQHAHEVLTDESKRAAYDASLGQPRRGPAGGTGSSPSPGAGSTQSQTSSGPSPASATQQTGPGIPVPAEAYSGPLPRETHDVDAMPWVKPDPDRTVRVTNAETPWWAALLTVLVGIGMLLYGMEKHPLMLFPAAVMLPVLLLRQIGLAGAKTWAAMVLSLLISIASPLLQAIFSPQAPWLSQILYGALAGAGIVLILVVHGRYLRRRYWMRSKFVREGFSWGKPGAGLNDAVDKFKLDDVMDGVEGESLTAAEIGCFLGDIPGVRLVNGLRFPGSSTADVDHAVVCGDRIAFIDSKAWAPTTFTMNRDWSSIRETLADGTWRYRETHMHTAVDAYEQALQSAGIRDAQVRGYIVVHPKSLDRPLTLQSQDSSDYNRMVTAPELIAELGAWFTEDPDQTAVVDRRKLTFLVGSMRG